MPPDAPAAEALAGALRVPWTRQGDWAGSLLFRGMVFAGLGRAVPAWTGVAAGTQGFLQAGPATWLVDGAFDAFAAEYLARCRAEPALLLRLAARFESVMAEVDALRADLERAAPGHAPGLAGLVERYAALDMASQPYSYVFGYGEDAIVARLLRDVVERHGVPASSSAAFAAGLLLAPPDVPTDVAAAQDGLLVLGAKVRAAGLRRGGVSWQAAPVSEAIRAFAARFGHVVGDADAVLAAVRAQSDPVAERARRRLEAEQREAAWARRVDGLALDKAEEELVRGVRRQVGIRTQRRERWMRARAAFERLLPRMADALGAGVEDLHLLTHEELAASLRGAALPADLRARRGASALLAWRGELFVFTGPEAGQLLAHARAAAVAEAATDRLLGVGASPGRVTGTVRVVLGPGEQDKVGKGEVLVTDMTEPDLVLACERSAAIVTDLGGMLCHAAIISRELGIPCVLATRRATQVLRDGDVVEVDGEAGTVVVVRRGAQGPGPHPS